LAFTLAHFSDVHLAPLPKRAAFENFSLKRLIGGASWHFDRRKFHKAEMANALRADILAAKPNHVAFTGDLVNIAAQSEFRQGLQWLQQFGDGDFLSFTPGNHDAYVNVPWAKGLGLFEQYMSSDMRVEAPFPFIRLRRNVALIGVNGACPQSLFRAGGTVGEAQRQRLATALQSLGERGFYRVVMIHHPPAPGLSHPLRSLSDAPDLKTLLEKHGAELVVHGHNHVQSLSYIGSIPVVGVPSASMSPSGHHHPAAWNSYGITRGKGSWKTDVKTRQWNAGISAFEDTKTFSLGLVS
jgi:3',5'-cyclic AMP phosphodiesterase CpdA